MKEKSKKSPRSLPDKVMHSCSAGGPSLKGGGTFSLTILSDERRDSEASEDQVLDFSHGQMPLGGLPDETCRYDFARFFRAHATSLNRIQFLDLVS